MKIYPSYTKVYQNKSKSLYESSEYHLNSGNKLKCNYNIIKSKIYIKHWQIQSETRVINITNKA